MHIAKADRRITDAEAPGIRRVSDARPDLQEPEELLDVGEGALDFAIDEAEKAQGHE